MKLASLVIGGAALTMGCVAPSTGDEPGASVPDAAPFHEWQATGLEFRLCEGLVAAPWPGPEQLRIERAGSVGFAPFAVIEYLSPSDFAFRVNITQHWAVPMEGVDGALYTDTVPAPYGDQGRSYLRSLGSRGGIQIGFNKSYMDELKPCVEMIVATIRVAEVDR